jgi:hypothetical protein
MADLVEGSKACSFECSSMSLGALMKAMKGMKLLGPKPAPPFEGYSLDALKRALHKITMPDYHLFERRRSKLDEYGNKVITKYNPHLNTCNLSGGINRIINEHHYGINGLKLDDVIDVGKTR